MTTWTTDANSRLHLTDPATGTRYRIGETKAGWQLAVFLAGERRSCNRHLFETVGEAQHHASERIRNDIELASLGRITRRLAIGTPWGRSRTATSYGEGVELFSTADRDGFRLSPAMNAAMPEHLRLEDGWYEEDSDGCRVALGLPSLFTTLELKQATEAAQVIHPRLYESLIGSADGSPRL